MGHAHVAGQRVRAQLCVRGHVLCLVPVELVGRGRVVVEKLKPHVSPVRDHDRVGRGRRAGVPRAPMVLHKLAMGCCPCPGHARVKTGGRASTKRLVHERARCRLKGVDVVRAVAVAEIHVLAVGWRGKPCWDVWGLAILAAARVVGTHVGATRFVLAKQPILEPDDAAIERGLGQLLGVVGVVEELLVALGRDLEAVGRARTERRITRERATRAVRIPRRKAVRVGLPVVLVRQDDVFVLVDAEPVAVGERCTGRFLQQLRHVLVAVFARAADDGGHCRPADDAMLLRCAFLPAQATPHVKLEATPRRTQRGRGPNRTVLFLLPCTDVAPRGRRGRSQTVGGSAEEEEEGAAG